MALINQRTGLPAEYRPEEENSSLIGEQLQQKQAEPTATEQFRQLTEAKERELENILLKKTLTEYSAKYEELEKMLLKALAEIEESNKQQSAMIAQKLQAVQMINSKLEQTLIEHVEEIGDDLRYNLTKPVNQAIEKQERNIEALTKLAEKAAEDTKSEINKLKTKTAQFWVMSNIQRVLFWISVPANIVLAIYILVDLFAK